MLRRSRLLDILCTQSDGSCRVSSDIPEVPRCASDPLRSSLQLQERRVSLEQQIEFQRKWRDHVKENVTHMPEGELDYAQAILESLERLRGLER